MEPVTNTRVRVAKPRKLDLRMSSGKTLTESERKRVRARLEELVDQYGSQVGAARAIGTSQQVISRVLQGDPAGMEVARRVARHDGVSVYQLLTIQSVPALEKLLRADPKRWSPPTVAALREIAKTRTDLKDVGLGYWESLANSVEHGVAAALDHQARRQR